MRAIITVTGKDHTGIVASVSKKLADVQVNILDISQTLMEEYFTMILLCDFTSSPHSIPEVREQMKEIEAEEKLVVRIQSEEIFNAMHTL
ncbi:ACT domain-containing protein [Jeotgalibaca sp. MA1X17-3]|uniref:ACT domain-containing protein n=1 Tax=Jeotgalibaca sp. MA1X17-3 TaxID=2908211 RepID=UPI001F4264E6|nr:ACT domain-containing protein [Jeotgalibaca sp. MA1X17-3]UJF15789.1 ACT domain-containing protein [Jeotgalibaca sp. MA1X17-3]